MQHLRPHCIIFMHYRSCPITADQTWRSCLAGSDVTKNAEGVVQSLEVTEGIKIYIYIYQNHARNPFRDLLSYVVMSAHVRFIKIQSRYVPYCTDEKEWRRLILVCSDFPRHLPSSSIIFIFKACRNMTKQYSSGLTMPLLIIISEVLFNLGPSWRHECGAQHGPCCQCSCQGCQRTRCCCLTAADWQIWQLKKKGLNQLHRIMKIETVRLPLPCVSLAFRPSGQDWIAGFSRVNPKKPCC